MKPKPNALACVALSGGLLGALPIKAQTVGCPQVDPGFYPKYRCELTPKWVDPVGLDQDWVPEFWHGSYRQIHTYFYDASGNAGRTYTDENEAFVPAPHVALYAKPWPKGLVGGLPAMILEPGQRIEVAPVAECGTCVSWAWDPPEAWVVREVTGLGTIDRVITQWPCGNEIPCSTVASPGYLQWRSTNLFGFRVAKADGWHLGWLRLAQTAPTRRSDGYDSGVGLIAFAVHPDTDTEIRAGEAPQPRLRFERSWTRLRLFWNTAFSNYRLERTARLGTPAWERVAGVETNSVWLDLPGATGFFRLRKPAAPP